MIRRTFFQDDFDDALAKRLKALPSSEHSSNNASKKNDIPVVSLNGSLNGTGPLNGKRSSTPQVDQAETVEEEIAPDLETTRSHKITTANGDIWVSGNALLCTCPDCDAPMTIRLWLELADCWRCDSSIQLSQEQIAAARQFFDAPEPASQSSISVPTVFDTPLPEPELDDEPSAIITPRPSSRHEELDRLTKSSLAAQVLRRGFSAIPAWLVSFLVHLILILLLALIMLGQQELPPTITLSTFFNKTKAEGGEVRIESLADMLVDDLMMASDLEIDESEIRDVLQEAERDANDLRTDDAPIAPLPDLDTVRQNITTRQGKLHTFAARDPRVRAEIVHREGGTSLTEASVARGLRWLASVQNHDGSWSLSGYDRHNRIDNEGDAAGTSLALLPFLGAGQTHEYGKYKQTVAKGLAWLLQTQKDNGDLRGNFTSEAGMYAHGQASIVLCETLALTGDQQFVLPAQRAVDFIESAQHIKGGWRYRPGQAGDTSILGWNLMALQSARSPNLGLDVNDDTLRLAELYLADASYKSNRRGIPDGSRYCYQPGRGSATPTMTAEALLCRMYLGWKREDHRMRAGVEWLIEEHLPSTREKNIYYWYYGTQVMHHYGGSAWTKWNTRIREILVSTQKKKGSRAGSWDHRDYQWGSQGGRIYVTSLAVCTLEVYYRHLPLFEQLDLEDIVE